QQSNLEHQVEARGGHLGLEARERERERGEHGGQTSQRRVTGSRRRRRGGDGRVLTSLAELTHVRRRRRQGKQRRRFRAELLAGQVHGGPRHLLPGRPAVAPRQTAESREQQQHDPLRGINGPAEQQR
ncbi:unnamed protein product, partial [Ectocarpus fasciculatus]